MKTKIIFISLTALILNGCFDKTTKEKTHTVDWFLNNLSILDDTLKKCDNNPGELLKTPNCLNAYKAKGKKSKEGKFVKSSGIEW